MLALCAVTVLLASRSALAESVTLMGPVTTFAPSALSGIRMVVRYEVARPDRRETDTVLLGAPSGDAADALPVSVQVEGQHGDPVTLADVDGADCVLARSAIVRNGTRVLLLTAVRTFDVKQVLAGGMSRPGPMDVQVYRRHDGGDGGESSPLFKAEDAPVRTGPVCSAAEVQRVLDDAARSALSEGARR